MDDTATEKETMRLKMLKEIAYDMKGSDETESLVIVNKKRKKFFMKLRKGEVIKKLQ
ncbi:hypothetical protein P3K76_04905 [Bacillus cytotoxicus]|nr:MULTISPECIES: hypothetical protein [Bacillus cereus group]MDH2864163.1 hypothetical protein [Bacillus cytotoxicus]MDH2886282.1 hypothetical protein [Bacillus cytotoxicus]MDH2889489.1 hypothetical protein [Bacillus cytotoxicus]NZD34798.1 hypothetical protein [Bacillus cytotoxicus]HDR7214771.1 hypothetical protein [Bacillus cytotoxicus]